MLVMLRRIRASIESEGSTDRASSRAGIAISGEKGHPLYFVAAYETVLRAARRSPGRQSGEVDDMADGHTDRHMFTLNDEWFEPPLAHGVHDGSIERGNGGMNASSEWSRPRSRILAGPPEARRPRDRPGASSQAGGPGTGEDIANLLGLRNPLADLYGRHAGQLCAFSHAHAWQVSGRRLTNRGKQKCDGDGDSARCS